MDKYYIPKDGSLHSYKEYISMLPNVDNPEAFGQHPNADIASQITEARNLFETLLSLQPKIATKTGVSQEEKVRMTELRDDKLINEFSHFDFHRFWIWLRTCSKLFRK